MTHKEKERKNKVDEEKLDFDDLGGLDDDLDLGGMEDIDINERSPGVAGVASELSKEAGKGFLDGLVSKTAEKALPPEYMDHGYEAMDYVSLAKETFDENKTKLDKSIYKLGKEVKKILPFQFKMLDNFLEKYESDFEQVRQESEESLRENSIQSNLTGIFDKQLEVQKALEARRQATDTAETKERLVNNKLNLDVLTSIDSNVSNQTAFTLQISKEYYRKNLELQYKTYFIQADLLKTTRDYFKGFSVQFDNIVKNTGLPDFVKLNNAELLKEEIKRQTTQKIYGSVFSNNKYVEGIKKKMKGLVNEKVSNVTDSIDSLTGGLEMLNSAGESGAGGPLQLLTSVAAGIGGSTIGEKLADKISPKLKDKIKDNKYINAGANHLSSLANSPTTFFASMKEKAERMAEDNADEGSPTRFLLSKLGKLGSGLLDVTTPDSVDTSIESKKLHTHDKPAIFDNRVHRSITDVIPMYLSKILKENTDLRTMYFTINKPKLGSKYKETDTLHYDYEKRNLDTKDQLRTNIEESMLSDNVNKNKINRTSESLLQSARTELNKSSKSNSILPDVFNKEKNILDDKKRKKLLDNFLSQASKDKSVEFNYDTVIKNYEELGKKNKSLGSLLENDKLKELLDVLKEKTPETNKKIDDSFSETRRKYPVAPIIDLFKSVSLLAGDKPFNDINEVQAEIISEAFLKYTHKSRKDILPSDIADKGKCFMWIKKKDLPEVADAIRIFISNISSITRSDDFEKESKLDAIIGVLNVAIRESVKYNIDMFKMIRESTPDVIDDGEVDITSMVEGKILMRKDVEEESLSNDDLRSLYKVSGTEIKEIKKTVALNAFDRVANKVADIAKGYGEIVTNSVKDSKNVLDLARNLSRAINTVSKDLSEKTATAYNSFKSELQETTKDLEKMLKDKSETAVNMFINKTSNVLIKYIRQIDEIKNSEDIEMKNKIGAINALKEEYSNAKAGEELETLVAKADKEIEKIKKYNKMIIDKLTTVQSTLHKQLDMLNNTDGTTVSVKDVLTNIKVSIDKTIESLESVLKDAQRQAKLNETIA